MAVLGRVSPADVEALAPRSRQGGVVTTVLTRPSDGKDPLPQQRSGLIVVDATQQPFPRAWNEACLRWKTVAVPNSPVPPSPR